MGKNEIRMTDTRKSLGNHGEFLALQYLESLGYKLKKKNFRIRSGEIDLIMTDSNILVFVDVRTKSSSFYGSPLETVNFIKRRKIAQVATFYLHRFHGNAEIECRFDVIGIVMLKNKNPQITHIKDAFLAGE